MADLVEIRTELRIRLGSPAVTMISDDALDVAINSAVEEMSRVYPIVGYETLTLVSNIAEYDVAEDVISVLEVVLPPVYANTDERNEGFDLFHNPSLTSIIEQKLEHWRERMDYEWEWNEDTRKILIIPTPTFSGLALYKGGKTRDIDHVPASKLKAFKDLCYAEGLGSMAKVYGSGGITSIPIGIGNVSYSNTSLLQESYSIKAEALRKFSVGGSSVVSG